jgi:hypothetical protein
VQESAAAQPERIVVKELQRRQWGESALSERRKGDQATVAMARRLRAESTVTLAWIAERLRMGPPPHLAHLLYWHRRERK